MSLLWCPQCNDRHDESQFYLDRSSPTGRDHLCKPHRRATVLRYRLLNRPQEANRAKRWRMRKALAA